MVNEFHEVFSKDLSGLSPNTKIDFRIDLLSNTHPISISTYRMAPPEFEGVERAIKGFFVRFLFILVFLLAVLLCFRA